jgi:hypothetical protein
MPINVTCPKCGNTSTAPDQFAGKRGKCKRCGAVTEIPMPAAAQAVAPSAVLGRPSVAPILDEPELDDIPPIVLDEDDEAVLSEPQKWRPPAVPGPAPASIDSEPWYYKFLVIYAHVILAIGALIAILFALAALFRVVMSLGQSLPLWMRVTEFASIIIMPAAVLFGASLIAAPILLAVDAARKLRLLCLQGMTRS